MNVSTGFSARTSPAFVRGGLGWEPNPKKPDQGWNNEPLGGWVCYQCAELFTSARQAEAHFGSNPKLPPLCLMVADLCGRVRDSVPREALERLVRRAIGDPGMAAVGGQGMRGERPLLQWQTDAVMAVLEYGMLVEEAVPEEVEDQRLRRCGPMREPLP